MAKNKKLIESLYDMASSKKPNGLSQFDEHKLRQELLRNDKLMARNKDVFEKEEPKFLSCKRYKPCPICDKCENKASHLYLRCQNCNIPICMHYHKDKVMMIKRKNFAVRL